MTVNTMESRISSPALSKKIKVKSPPHAEEVEMLLAYEGSVSGGASTEKDDADFGEIPMIRKESTLTVDSISREVHQNSRSSLSLATAQKKHATRISPPCLVYPPLPRSKVRKAWYRPYTNWPIKFIPAGFKGLANNPARLTGQSLEAA